MNFLTAHWKNLALINYEIDAIILDKYIPMGTEIDLWNNKCYVSLVGFMFENTKVLGLKIQSISSFLKPKIMKTLQNQTLLYDEDCPLCQVYTSGFIKAKMLDKNGRKSYCELSIAEQNFVDINRASNEIALIDNQNQTVLYGIDSLLKVIGFSFPLIEKIGNIKPIKFLLEKLYSFVSYNRKVIIPSKINKEIKLQCIPNFNYKYRFLFIGFATVVTTIVLYNYSFLIISLPKANIVREFIISLGQLIFQSLFILKLDKKTILNYTGNLMTVSLMGSLLLLPMLALQTVLNISENTILAWFAITAFIMFMEHYRRIKILELPTYLCLTWVLYRVIVLSLILNY